MTHANATIDNWCIAMNVSDTSFGGSQARACIKSNEHLIIEQIRSGLLPGTVQVATERMHRRSAKLLLLVKKLVCQYVE